jgi:hypothetical protein
VLTQLHPTRYIIYALALVNPEINDWL